MASPFTVSQGVHDPPSWSPQPLPTRGGCPSVSFLALRLTEGFLNLSASCPLLTQAPLLPGTIRLSSTNIRSGMSTGSLMTWWLRSSSLRAALCGPARTMTETCSRTSWPRVRFPRGWRVDRRFFLAGREGVPGGGGGAGLHILLGGNCSSGAAGLGLACSSQDLL